MWSKALQEADGADAVINFGYDWLPLWITPHVCPPVFHLISMGSVASVMGDAVEALAAWDQRRLAFHTTVRRRTFNCRARRVWSATVLTCRIIKSAWRRAVPWAGLDALPPKKGLRMPPLPPLPWGTPSGLGDCVRTTLMPMRWSLPCHRARSIGVGFLPTQALQLELGQCRALINTPKWNEAYGNVVVEALACGVPVVAYDRGGPGELICSGKTGFLVRPDDVVALTQALRASKSIDRRACRAWVEEHAAQEVFARGLKPGSLTDCCTSGEDEAAACLGVMDRGFRLWGVDHPVAARGHRIGG